MTDVHPNHFGVDPLLPVRQYQTQLLASAQADDPTLPKERQMPLALRRCLFQILNRDLDPAKRKPDELARYTRPPTIREWARGFNFALQTMVDAGALLRPTPTHPFRYSPGKENEYIQRYLRGDEKKRTERIDEIIDRWLKSLAATLQTTT